MKTVRTCLHLALSALLFAAAPAAAGDVDAAIPGYEKVRGVSGSINSIGSDTMNNLMALWCEGFARYYPNVRCQIEGKGSSTAPPALIEGTAQIGPMSRPMKSSEKDKFQAKFGYEPRQVKTSLDSLAVYVHKDNPIKGLSIEQVDAIFSKTRNCGGPGDIKVWGDLGLTGEWTNRPISMFGRNSASGTYAYVKKHALCKGDYKDEVKEQPGSASVVQGITEDRYAIGYSGIGYITSGVRTVPLAKKGTKEYSEPSSENILSGKYPLGRFLYVYVNESPTKGLDPLIGEFVKYILSREGQKVVVKDGYEPLPAKIVKDQRAESK
jgi:phosphate transport system substrate-binding protein